MAAVAEDAAGRRLVGRVVRPAGIDEVSLPVLIGIFGQRLVSGLIAGVDVGDDYIVAALHDGIARRLESGVGVAEMPCKAVSFGQVASLIFERADWCGSRQLESLTWQIGKPALLHIRLDRQKLVGSRNCGTARHDGVS